ncbi:MAG: efflux RND transporter periplasmic adaptor subunit [bacterium]|nr:efflux RND transporter periplasmic adaptor subunit [bacterium]
MHKTDSQVLVSNSQPNRSRQILISFAMLALVLASMLALIPLQGCQLGDGADSTIADSTQTAKKPKKEKKSSVSAVTVIKDNLVLPIIAEGSIVARQSTGIRSEVSGRITRLHCTEGERVRKGQLLISLDKRDYQVAMEEARANYLQALSTLAIETGEDELAEAAATEWLSDRSLENQIESLQNGEFRRELNTARTGLSSAQAAITRAKLNLERCEVRAPFGGVITGMQLSPGSWISASQDLFTLIDDVNLEARVQVLESDLGDLELGRPALIALPALGDTLQVKVDIINPALDVASRSCEAILRITNESGKIKPGMFARASIAGEILSERMLVPREAVLTRDNRPLVFKVADGITQWVYVQLGERNEQFYEIERALQGGTLEPGDKVVVTNHLTLTHGAKVKVKKVSEPTIPWDLGRGDE